MPALERLAVPLVFIAAISCTRSSSTRPVTARLAAQFGCGRSLQVVVVGTVDLSASEQCVISTAALRYWWDSLAPRLKLDSSTTGSVGRVYLWQVTVPLPIPIPAPSAPNAASPSPKTDTFWVVRIELPKYRTDSVVAISTSTGAFQVGTAHKTAGS